MVHVVKDVVRLSHKSQLLKNLQRRT